MIRNMKGIYALDRPCHFTCGFLKVVDCSLALTRLIFESRQLQFGIDAVDCMWKRCLSIGFASASKRGTPRTSATLTRVLPHQISGSVNACVPKQLSRQLSRHWLWNRLRQQLRTHSWSRVGARQPPRYYGIQPTVYCKVPLKNLV